MRLKYLRKLSWRAWTVVAVLATGGLIAGLALTGGGSPGALSDRTSSDTVINAPAHQMAELNFLLGSFTCATTGKTAIYETTRKVLNGTYYQMEVSEYVPGKGRFIAYWTLGWDPVDLDFAAQYFDNLGNTGTATSAGWKNGQFVLPGRYAIVAVSGGAKGVGRGSPATSKDVFRIVGANHYVDDSYVSRNGKWVSEGGGDCRRAL